MGELVEISLGSEAIEYIRTRLGEGQTLARRLLEKVDLTEGAVTTLLPDDVSEEAARQLTWGGKLKVDPGNVHYLPGSNGRLYRVQRVPTLEAELVSAIQSYLKGASCRVCVFEDDFLRASDPGMESEQGRILPFGEEVYRAVSEASSEDEIAYAVQMVNSSWPALIAVLASLPSEQDLSSVMSKLGPDEFDLLAEHTDKIVIGAYDAEGFLTWSRSSR